FRVRSSPVVGGLPLALLTLLASAPCARLVSRRVHYIVLRHSRLSRLGRRERRSRQVRRTPQPSKARSIKLRMPRQVAAVAPSPSCVLRQRRVSAKLAEAVVRAV